MCGHLSCSNRTLTYLDYCSGHLTLIILLCSCHSWGCYLLLSDPNSAILSKLCLKILHPWPYPNPMALHPIALLFFIPYEIIPSQKCDQRHESIDHKQWGWMNMWICPLHSLENQLLSKPFSTLLATSPLPFCFFQPERRWLLPTVTNLWATSFVLSFFLYPISYMISPLVEIPSVTSVSHLPELTWVSAPCSPKLFHHNSEVLWPAHW